MSQPLTVDLDLLEQFPLPPGSDAASIAPLVNHILEAEGKSGRWEVAIAFISDGALRAMHRDFMGADTETDVMTFPRDPDPWDGARGGDIAISVERAKDQAPDFGLSAWDEIRFLVAHGTLHLCGWDDASEADRARMLSRQRELIDSFDSHQG